jgi:16S rRNA G966 N2-methylase RsmD
MQVSQAFYSYIKEHAEDDLAQLLLSADRYPDIDVPFAVEQIRARRYIREKLPAWYANDWLLYPSKIAVEQCSSEQTAQYKQRLIKEGQQVCDLTGGLGVDTCYFAQKANQVVYVERSEKCFETAMYNFSQLHIENIDGYNEDADKVLQNMQTVDVIYIDPARRGEENHRMHALSDCEPDLEKMLPLLLSKTPKVIAKLSPMLDIRHTLALLPQTSEIHVVSVRNECKELLFVIQNDVENREPAIYCINFTTEGAEQSFRFTLSDEQSSGCALSNSVQTFLYEPNVSILKAGAYKQIANRFGIAKLHTNSHLYTSEKPIPDFPGRIFQVREVYPFSGKLCKTIRRTIPQANITTRNFPLPADELRLRTRIADGGDCYLFATTLADGGKVLIQCIKPPSTTC